MVIDPHMFGRQKKGSRVAVVGGGVAGSTVALKLAEQGLEVQLFERGQSLVNGPPMCHLHAGGCLYREISDQHCIELLQQSIDTYRSFPQSIKVRPTVIAVPKRDPGDPLALLPRLTLLQQHYQKLVERDPANKVLGEAEHYFQLFDKAQMQALAQRPLPANPVLPEEWMIPVAKQVDLDQLTFPLVLVQEYGVSLFRVAASVALASKKLPNLTVNLATEVTDIQALQPGWKLSVATDGVQQHHAFDYLINACGFRSGQLDDLAGFKRQRMVEFKAAYLAHWPECEGVWPEVVFHGERGTPHGMAQLTPYADNVFQLHGMTPQITLFKQGRVASGQHSAQPKLAKPLLDKINLGWSAEQVKQRTVNAIEHMRFFIPEFGAATVAGKPLFGAQQIPGKDPSLRASTASFAGQRYSRTEIVKLSSALTAANEIIADLQQQQLLGEVDQDTPLTSVAAIPAETVIELAQQLALTRHYPKALAL